MKVEIEMKKTINLELTVEEASVLLAVIGSISGEGKDSFPRDFLQELFVKFRERGISADYERISGIYILKN